MHVGLSARKRFALHTLTKRVRDACRNARSLRLRLVCFAFAFGNAFAYTLATCASLVQALTFACARSIIILRGGRASSTNRYRAAVMDALARIASVQARNGKTRVGTVTQ